MRTPLPCHRTSRSWAAALTLVLIAGVACAQDATISVDATTRHQLITGWEATAEAGEEEAANTFQAFKGDLYDKLVDEMGVTRIRLEVRSGSENDTDYYDQWQKGEIEKSAYRARRYATVNDNADPDVIDWSGFHFTELDWHIENIILPIKQRVEANDEKLHLNLCYVAFTTQINGGDYGHDDADEYGEFIEAVWRHIDDKYGWTPDSVEIILEPDNVPEWNGTVIGNAIVEVAKHLKAAGFEVPNIIAPSCTAMTRVPQYLDDMLAIEGVEEHLSEICYHRYDIGNSGSGLAAITSRAKTNGLQTSMLEWFGASYTTLHQDLKTGNVSAWSLYVIAGKHSSNGFLYKIDDSNANDVKLEVTSRSRHLRQYFKFVRPGATRIEATTSNANFDPVAFENANGTNVVVVKCSGAGDVTVNDLPAGTYEISYTTASEYAKTVANQTIAAGEAISTSIPAAGALTIAAKAPPPKPDILITTAFSTCSAGVTVSWQLEAEGGTAPYVWTLESGTYPVAGAPSADGSVDGQIGAPGQYDFELTVTDANGTSVTKAFTMTVGDAPEIVTPRLPLGVLDRPFQSGLEVQEGVGGLTWDLVSGALAPGLSLDATSGAITGHPTAEGDFEFSARCTDLCGGSDTRAYALTIVPRSEWSGKKTVLREELAFDLEDGAGPARRALELLGGTRLTITAKYGERGDPPVSIELIDAAGENVDLTQATHVSRRKRQLQVKGQTITKTGRYVVVVTPQAPFEGTVRLDLRVSPPKRRSGPSDVGATEAREITVSTLPGAQLSIRANAARKSDARPTILSVRDTLGNELLDPKRVKTTRSSASVRLKSRMPGGDIVIRLGTREGTAGQIKWQATIKEPRGYRFAQPDVPSGYVVPEPE